MARAGAQKRPRKADDSFAGVGAHAHAATRGDSYQVGSQRDVHHFARVKLAAREQDCRIERATLPSDLVIPFPPWWSIPPGIPTAAGQRPPETPAFQIENPY